LEDGILPSDSLGAKLRVVFSVHAYDTNIVTYKADALNNPRNSILDLLH